MPKPKHATSYSLTPDAKDLLDRLSDAMGVPRNKVLELAIRRMARTELPREQAEEKNVKKSRPNH